MMYFTYSNTGYNFYSTVELRKLKEQFKKVRENWDLETVSGFTGCFENINA